MVTLADTILYHFIIITALAAVAVLRLFLIIRSKCNEKNILTLVANESFGTILVLVVLAVALTSPLGIFAIGFALLGILSFAVVSYLRRARTWVRYLVMGISLGLILLLCCFVAPVGIQTFILLVILFAVSTLILFVSMRLIYTRIEFLPGLAKLRIGYICISVVLASIVAFLISCSLLEAIGRIDISYTLKNLDKSDRLLITTHGYYTEEIEITNKETIHRVRDIIENTKYKMDYIYGAFSISDSMYLKIYSGEREIGEFGIVDNYASFNSPIFMYASCDRIILVRLKEAVGAKLENQE